MEACQGTAALYTSPDFKKWTSAGDWTSQVNTAQAHSAFVRQARSTSSISDSILSTRQSSISVRKTAPSFGPFQGIKDSSVLPSKRLLGTWIAASLIDNPLPVQALLGQAQNGQCAPPPVAQPGNGGCDQFGASCRMWECPDVFDMGNGTWAFKWSDQVPLCPLFPLAFRLRRSRSHFTT